MSGVQGYSAQDILLNNTSHTLTGIWFGKREEEREEGREEEREEGREEEREEGQHN